jgi:Flp pilus assembly protein TadG
VQARGTERAPGSKDMSALRVFASRVHALLRHGEEGGAVIELGFALPALLLLFTGIATAGVAMRTYVQLTEAVSNGARVAAVSRGQTLNPCKTVSSAVIAAAPSLTSASFTFSYVLNGTSYSGTSCSSTSTTTGAAGNLVQGGTAIVSATYPCNLAVFGKNFAPNCVLTASTSELVQ